MTKEDHSTTHQTPAALIVLAGILSLSVFVLIMVNYAFVAENTTLIVAGILLVALLSFLTIRLWAQTRQVRAQSRSAVAPQPTATVASWLVLCLTLLATVLRVCQLGAESFWYDETWTATWAAQPIGTVVHSNAPLAYLVAHFTQFLSRSEFGLRMAPALAGTLLIPATYLLGSTLYRRKEGLIAAGMLAVSVYAIYHSQELRFYAWQMLFSTLTLYFLLRGLKHQRWQDWVAFALATVLNLYSHPYGLFVLASEGLYTIGVLSSEAFSREERNAPWRTRVGKFWRQARGAIGATSVALLAHLPVWPSLLGMYNSKWVGDTSQLQYAPAISQGISWFASPLATWMYELPSALLALKHPVLLLVLYVLFFMGLLTSPRRWVALVLVWFLVPPVILYFMKVRFYHRYVSYFLPLFAIVVAHGINYLASIAPVRRHRRWLIVGLLTVIVAIPSIVQLPEYYLGTQKAQWREAIAFVEDNRRPGDIALVMLNSSAGAAEQPIDWYRTVPDTELPWQFFPEGGRLTSPDQLRELPAVTQGYQRVWFVLPEAVTEMDERISSALQGQFQLAQEQEFVHLQVALYETTSPGSPP